MLTRPHLLASLLVLLPAVVTGCADDASSSGGGADGGEGGSGEVIDPLDDLDNDGHASLDAGGDDCDDTDADTYPGAPDSVGDAVDQDCDGLDGVDADGDGYASVDSGGADCDDALETTHPGASDDGELGHNEIFTAERPSQDTQIALDSEGNVHVAFTETYNGSGNAVSHRVNHATNRSGVWTSELIGTGFASDIAIAGDRIAVLHGNASGVHLTERPLAEMAWSSASAADDGFPSSFSVAPDGELHFAVVDDSAYPTRSVRHVFSSAGEWSFEEIVVLDQADRADLALDPSGVPSIAYLTMRELDVARPDGGGWATDTPATDADSSGLRLHVDDAGHRHALYSTRLDSSSYEVRYATDASGSWQTSTVMPVPARNLVDLAVGPDGKLHMVVSLSHYGSHLYYGTLTAQGWAVYPLLKNADWGRHASLVVADDNTVHISYTGGYSVFHASIAAANGVDDDCDGSVW